ncbi:anti-sigma factor domain-containing protein [Gottfriedia acidiceleris]|uniref:anti-sigma factor domain-containing protein n=1 Tax=Gottfriedia acidiceleris TaxID=371036 RepID=UPI003D214AC6
MNNGIVLKVNRSSVVVLTANGEYLKCKKLLSSYSIGEEIQFPNHAIILKNKVRINTSKMIPVIIASALILMSFVFVNWNNKKVLAAGKVTIVADAKVSLFLDKQLKVISLKGHNEQGKKVINKMDNWKQKPLQIVMDDLVDEMEKSKVIEPDEKIKLTGEMNKKFKNKQGELNSELKDIQESNSHINIPNSNDLDKPKVETRSQSLNTEVRNIDSRSTEVTKRGNSNKDQQVVKSHNIDKNNAGNHDYSKEDKNNRHQEEHRGNKQRQWNHKNQEEHHESSKQNQNKQNNNDDKDQDKKKNEYHYGREVGEKNSLQKGNDNNDGCHDCYNRDKDNENDEDEDNNGLQYDTEKRSD